MNSLVLLYSGAKIQIKNEITSKMEKKQQTNPPFFVAFVHKETGTLCTSTMVYSLLQCKFYNMMCLFYLV